MTIVNIPRFNLLIAAKTLVQSVVISRLDYCNSVCVGLSLKSIHRLQLPHNAAARVVNKSSIFENVDPLLRDLHWLPILKRVQFKILVLTYKIFFIVIPQYIYANC